MSRDPDHNHYVRKVVLPSGKTIEVVYFEDHAATDRSLVQAPARTQDPAREMHVCGSCDSQLVYPTDWCEANADGWQVTLRCPNCEWSETGVFAQDAVERFDDELDRGTEAVVDDLRRLLHANMEAEIDRFVSALHAGHIQPEDF